MGRGKRGRRSRSFDRAFDFGLEAVAGRRRILHRSGAAQIMDFIAKAAGEGTALPDGWRRGVSGCPRFSAQSGFKPVLSAASFAPRLSIQLDSFGANPTQEKL